MFQASLLDCLFLDPFPFSQNGFPSDSIERIFDGKSENQRMANLFREAQNEPITRDVVEAVAQQKDFMRRIRSDNGRGTRDILAVEGILLLSGDYDALLIEQLGLKACSGSEFISHKAKSKEEVSLAAQYGIEISDT